MAKKKLKRAVHKPRIKDIKKIEMNRDIPGLSRNKGDGIMAIMAAVLVILTSILNKEIAVILAVILMVLFAAYKLIFKK